MYMTTIANPRRKRARRWRKSTAGPSAAAMKTATSRSQTTERIRYSTYSEPPIAAATRITFAIVRAFIRRRLNAPPGGSSGPRVQPPAHAAGHVDERVGGANAASQDVADEHGVVVHLEQGAAAAAQVGERARDPRDAVVPVPLDARELVVAEAGEHVGERLLVGGQH